MLELEFQPQRVWCKRGLWVVLALALIFFGLTVLDFHTLKQREQTLQLSLLGTEKLRVPARTVRENQPRSADEVRAANLIVQSLNVPWGQLMTSFEARQPGDVALLAIEPDAKKQMLRVTGEARTLANLPDYVDLLTRQGVLKDVVLIEHQVQLQDPQRPVRFVVQASWGGRSERLASNVR